MEGSETALRESKGLSKKVIINNYIVIPCETKNHRVFPYF